MQREHVSENRVVVERPCVLGQFVGIWPGMLKLFEQSFETPSRSHPKSTKMAPNDILKAILEKGRFWDPPRGGERTPLGVTSAILAAILGSAERQGVHTIEHFGTKSRTN